MLRSASVLDLPFIASLHSRAPSGEAATPESLTGFRGLVNPAGLLLAQGFAKRSRRYAVIVTSQGRAVGFGIVRRRMGVSCWEIERAEVARGAEGAWPELLEGLSGPVSIQGGQRLILRLADGSPLDRAAREAEYRPYCREELFALTARIQREPSVAETPGVRLAVDDDEFGLYQLYRSASPPSIREAEGLTIDQWKESRPAQAGWRTQGEYVFEREGRIAGWAAVTRRGGKAVIAMMVAGGNGEAASALVSATMQGAQGASAAVCLAPGHQPGVAAALAANGFVKRGDYALYVKHVAAQVREPGIAMARA